MLPKLTLAGATYAFVIVTALSILIGSALLFFPRSDRLLDTALDGAVRVRSDAVAEIFAKSLHDDWIDLEQLAMDIPGTSEEGLRGLMEGVQGDGQRVSWVGYAGTNGIVKAGSGGDFVGENVSDRAWFRNGIRGGFARDVHEPLLLARRDRGTVQEDPLRLLDLARPVRDAEGDIVGVVAMHISFGWAERAVTETARILGIDAYLISANGEVIVASDGGRPTPAELEILRTARAGDQSSGRETWPDGEDYFSSLVSSVGYGDLPSLGWRLVGRIPAAAFQPTIADLRGTILVTGIGLVSILVLFTSLFVIFFARPFSSLGSVSQKIADGAPAYPPEYRATREAAQISAALARLQKLRVNDRRN
ncbi:cache domain-containing protein [Roseivivax lentus]|uniref:cache domain-containing protein n=1 Tax=Roseivivax lentus TaxID=633194 RepID=UPI00097068D7|nr:cache domain-containing protein [Roseivivax lentus]